MGLVTEIWGRGRAGSPFGVTIAPQPDDAESDSAEMECAWVEEVRRRLAEVDSGTAELIPAEEVFAELRRRRAALEEDGEVGEQWGIVLDQAERAATGESEAEERINELLPDVGDETR
jgi:hypothetical protein